MMRSTKILFTATMLLAFAGILAPAISSAQEIPLPITRPCKHPCINKIRFVPGPQLDKLELHARINPATSIDPGGEAVTIELTNGNGDIIFTETLPPGAFKTTNGGKRYTYRNAAARSAGGLFKVQIAQRKDVNEGFRVDVIGYGDLSNANGPDITTFIAVGGDGFFDFTPWTQRNYGWSVDFAP